MPVDTSDVLVVDAAAGLETGGVDKRGGDGKSSNSNKGNRSTQSRPKEGPRMGEARNQGARPPASLDDLDTPTVVKVMLGRLPSMSASERLEYEREFKLSYYYEGLTVAICRNAAGVPEVVASGPLEEVDAVLNSFTPDRASHVTLIDPLPLQSIAAHLPERTAAKAG